MRPERYLMGEADAVRPCRAVQEHAWVSKAQQKTLPDLSFLHVPFSNLLLCFPP